MSSERDARLAAEIQSAIENSRGYAGYWEWAVDRKLAEMAVGEALARHLSLAEGLEIELARSLDDDPPDVEIVTANGHCLGIEVTELVDQKAAQRGRYIKQTGGESTSSAYWDAVRLASEVELRVRQKDKKLSKCRSRFDEMTLAIATDEPMITLELVNSALAAAIQRPQNIDRVFLLLGYHPDHRCAKFPEGIAVVEARLI